jgi:hypothetical protein
MEKILITGTGRCGTTFLIKIFSFLKFNTGYTQDNYKQSIFLNCNSGMENSCNNEFYIVKNPKFIENIVNIMKNTTVKIKLVIIPIRDYKESALSRVKNGVSEGGLWNAVDVTTQIEFYNKIMADYVYHMTKNEINTLFLDFDKMVTDKIYLFEKLKFILNEHNINFELFSDVFDEVTLISKPTLNPCIFPPNDLVQ